MILSGREILRVAHDAATWDRGRDNELSSAMRIYVFTRVEMKHSTDDESKVICTRRNFKTSTGSPQYSRLRFFLRKKYFHSMQVNNYFTLCSAQSSELIEGSSRTNFEARNSRTKKVRKKVLTLSLIFLPSSRLCAVCFSTFFILFLDGQTEKIISDCCSFSLYILQP